MKKFLRTLLVMAMALLMVAVTACAKNARLRPQRKQIRARRRPRRLPALNLYWEPSL